MCDDLWGSADAGVVCSQLGFNRQGKSSTIEETTILIVLFSGAQATSLSQFGQGSGAIHLDNVQCAGTETTLLQCTYAPIHNCAHFEDAGVICVNGSG